MDTCNRFKSNCNISINFFSATSSASISSTMNSFPILNESSWERNGEKWREWAENGLRMGDSEFHDVPWQGAEMMSTWRTYLGARQSQCHSVVSMTSPGPPQVPGPNPPLPEKMFRGMSSLLASPGPKNWASNSNLAGHHFKHVHFMFISFIVQFWELVGIFTWIQGDDSGHLLGSSSNCLIFSMTRSSMPSPFLSTMLDMKPWPIWGPAGGRTS